MELAFSSPTSLCSSFIVSNVDSTSDGVPYLADEDVFLVQECYRIVWEQNDEAQEQLMLSIENLVKTPQKLLKTQDLRLFIIILDCPGLLQAEYHTSVVVPLLSHIATLSKPYKDCLYTWWSTCRGGGPRAAAFKNTVNAIQQFLTFRLFAAMESNLVLRQDKETENALEVLSILYWSNESCRLLPFQTFYNDAINSAIDINRDYHAWISGTELAFHRYPFVLSLGNKSVAIRTDALRRQNMQYRATLASLLTGVVESPYLRLKLRRSHVLDDALSQLSISMPGLNKPVQVQFVGEGAVDGGGVSREFFQLIVSELFDPRSGLFTWSDETRLSFFNPDCSKFRLYQLAGIVVGLAIYNGVILDVHLPLFVFGRLMNRSVSLSDLAEINPVTAEGLHQLMISDVSGMQLTFTAAISTASGKVKAVVPLKHGGQNIAVSNENKAEYIKLYVECQLIRSVTDQFDAFARGFFAVVDTPVFKVLRPDELLSLVAGAPVGDMTIVERAAQYHPPYSSTHPLITMFWSVVHSFNTELKRRLMLFTTGCERIPAAGVGYIDFVIVPGGTDTERLPSAHTCLGMLSLPTYSSTTELRRQLMIALRNAEGFGLE